MKSVIVVVLALFFSNAGYAGCPTPQDICALLDCPVNASCSGEDCFPEVSGEYITLMPRGSEKQPKTWIGISDHYLIDSPYFIPCEIKYNFKKDFTFIDIPKGRECGFAIGFHHDLLISDKASECVSWTECDCSPPPPPATITPTSGKVCSSFEIDDPAARLQQGDYPVFFLSGTDPLGEYAFPAPYGKTWSSRILGYVPQIPAVQFEVTVISPDGIRRIPETDERMLFDVTAGSGFCDVNLIPWNFGTAGNEFGVDDPQGRIGPNDTLTFDGVPVLEQEIAGNTRISGRIPLVPPGNYLVKVFSPEWVSRYEDLYFTVQE